MNGEELISGDGQENELSDGLKSLSEFAGLFNPQSKETTSESQEETPEKKLEKLASRAKLYKRGQKVMLALQSYEAYQAQKEKVADETQEQELSQEIDESAEDLQADALITQLETALGGIDRSLQNQIDYAIINHKQINTRDALEQELQSGTSIPELDIRFDKDGKPWISHSQRAGTRFFFSKPIHELHSEEVEKIGKRLSLEDGLEMIKEYYKDNPNHRVVLELKELGPNTGTHREYLERIKTMLEQAGLEQAAIFATLSPSILRSTHDIFPENSKILNGGIAPVISYDLAEKSQGEDQQKEFAFKLPNVELFFSNSSEIAERPDGYGKQTGYLWTRLPKETVATLRGMNESGGVGAASLTVVNKFANILDKLSPKMAKKLREHYAAQLDQLGIRKQVAIAKKKPLESLVRTKEQMGQDAIIYADVDPGNWAAELPTKDKGESQGL